LLAAPRTSTRGELGATAPNSLQVLAGHPTSHYPHPNLGGRSTEATGNAGRPRSLPQLEAPLKEQLRAAANSTMKAAKHLKPDVMRNELWELAMTSLKGCRFPSNTASTKFQKGANNVLSPQDVADCKKWVALTDEQRVARVEALRAQRATRHS